MTNLAVQVLLNNMVVVNHHLTNQHQYKIKNVKCEEIEEVVQLVLVRRSVNWVFNQLGRKLFRQVE